MTILSHAKVTDIIPSFSDYWFQQFHWEVGTRALMTKSLAPLRWACMVCRRWDVGPQLSWRRCFKPAPSSGHLALPPAKPGPVTLTGAHLI